MFKSKKIIFILVIAVSFIAVVGKTQAGALDNVIGWSWGGGTELDGVSPYDGINTNLGWISMNSGLTLDPTIGLSFSYGVNIPATDDAVTGYAWSENIGYINFAPAGPYPTVVTGDDYPNATKRLGDKLVGWARFEEIRIAGSNAGGWGGWIRLSSDANDPTVYGVDITKMDGTGTDPTYAWSDELGWIDFSGASIAIAPVSVACGDADTGGYYASDATEWTAGGTRAGNACVGDSAVPTVSFPDPGVTVSWQCIGSETVNCSGTRVSACVLPDCADVSTICSGTTCIDCTGSHDGTKICQNLNWREVSPN